VLQSLLRQQGTSPDAEMESIHKSLQQQQQQHSRLCNSIDSERCNNTRVG
jgi:hypothetical protein